MGVCSCRKRAELFCYVHRKAICSSCILDHPTCVVGPYLDWLRDSDYENPSCPVCSGHFDETSPTVRLTCLHIIHPSCLDHYASRLPPHTAQAGYGCPQCGKPIIPPEEDKTDLANTLRDVLETQEWAKTFLKGDQNGSIEMNGIQSPKVKEIGTDTSGREFTIPVSRKVVTRDDGESLDAYDTDNPENKYRRRGVMQLLVALGIVTPGQGGHVLNSRRLVVVFLVISMILFMWVLFKSAGQPPPRVV